MNNQTGNEIRFREKFENFSIKPSQKVWEQIGKANPKPVARPSKTRYLWMGSAAVVLMTAFLITLNPFGKPLRVAHSPKSELSACQPEKLVVSNPELNNRFEKTGDKSSIESHRTTASASSPTPASISTIEAEKVSSPVTPIVKAGGSTSEIKSAANSNNVPAGKPTSSAPGSNYTSSNPVTATAASSAKITGSDPGNDTTGGNGTNNQRLEVFIPNAFAPGTNGANNTFHPVIRNNAPVKEYKMQIFTRSGMLVFESSEIENGWDGKYQGDIVNDQVCVYIITFRDESGFPYAKKGTITLIR
jgi:gliding motility-associated-like protein